MELPFNETNEHTIMGECVDVEEGKTRPQFVEYCNDECMLPMGCLYQSQSLIMYRYMYIADTHTHTHTHTLTMNS